MMILTVYIISMKHFVASISFHPKTLLLKCLTWSMQMFSGTWTRLYLKEGITFPQGSVVFYIANPKFGTFFLMTPFLLYSSEKQLLCLARAILKKSKILVMDEVRRFITIYVTCRRI